jgi:aquaporin Z
LVVEFVGTFFLVLVVGLVVSNPSAGPLGPIGIASVLAVMVYAGGPVSGAHYNPAVSLAIRVSSKLGGRDLLAYWGAQLVGVGVASVLVGWLRPAIAPGPLQAGTTAVLLGEGLFTFALAWVVLQVAVSRASAGNSHFGFSIGFTVLAGAVAVGDLTGGAFNPGVTLALAFCGILEWRAVPLYLGVQLLAAAAAALLFRYVSPE